MSKGSATSGSPEIRSMMAVVSSSSGWVGAPASALRALSPRLSELAELEERMGSDLVGAEVVGCVHEPLVAHRQCRIGLAECRVDRRAQHAERSAEGSRESDRASASSSSRAACV